MAADRVFSAMTSASDSPTRSRYRRSRRALRSAADALAIILAVTAGLLSAHAAWATAASPAIALPDDTALHDNTLAHYTRIVLAMLADAGASQAGNPFAPITDEAVPAQAAPGQAPADRASPPSPAPTTPGFDDTGFGGFDISEFGAFARPVLRAQISPRRQTVLSAEISGKIDTFPLREGERFAVGDPLVGFDCAVHVARRDRSRAQEQSARRRLETAGRLDQLSSISRLEYDETVAALAVAEAETALSEIAVSRCTIAAPFPGRVAERLAEPYQYVAEGEPVIAILDDRDLEIALMVPSRWLAWLRPGHRFGVAIDELETSLEASVSRIGARVDPVSQSIRIFAAITQAPEGLIAGMSGEADLRPPSEEDASRGAP
jgi:membrane fusion protein (multidrug efflux system)